MTCPSYLGIVGMMEPETKTPVDLTMNGSRRVILVGVVAGVVGVVMGLLIGLQIGSKPAAPAADITKNASLILNQSAAATGKISSVQNKTLTLVNDSGKSQDFKIGDVITVYKYPVKNAPAQVFSGVSAIELNKQVLINLNSEGSDYVVATITYLEPTSSTSSPTATGSGTNK